MGASGRREREKQERRQAILEAAAKVFLEKGPAAASMDEIAERAELSKGTLYLYFSSKEDLFVAASAEPLDYLISLFREAVDRSTTGLEAIKWAGWYFLDFLVKHPGQFRMAFLSEGSSHSKVSPESMKAKAERQRECEHLIQTALTRAKEDGTLKPDSDIPLLSRLLWGHISGVLMLHSRCCYDDTTMDVDRLLEYSWKTTMDAFVTSPEYLELGANPADEME